MVDFNKLRLRLKGNLQMPENEPLKKNPDAAAIRQQAPWENIPTEMAFPEQYWEIRFNDYGEDFTSPQDGSNPKFFVDLEFLIMKPSEYAAKRMRLRYFVGNNDDPRAERGSTWIDPYNIGARNLKRLADFHGVRDYTAIPKDRSFCVFTENREYQGRKYMQFSPGMENRFYAASNTDFTPGTPLPHTAQRGRMPVNGGKAPVQPADTVVECTNGCGRPFKISEEAELIAHIQQCNWRQGDPKWTEVDDGIPF